MTNLVSLPVEADFLSLVWQIIANDFDLPADQVRLEPWQIAVIIEYLRNHSELIFDGLKKGQI